MPRISDTLTIGETERFRAIRPQNNTTPAAFREISATKKPNELTLLNMGASEESERYRSKLSLVVPVYLEGKQVDTNRIDLTARINKAATAAEIAQIKSDLRGLIASNEFDALFEGQQQY